MSILIRKSIILDVVLFLTGSIFYTLAINIFISPNDIAPGGVTGIAIILNSLFNLPIGTSMLLLNIPILIIGVVMLGKKFLIKTIIATILVSIFIDVSVLFLPIYVGDKMLASIFGGISLGVGLGMFFIRDATTGGSDIIARVISLKKPTFSIGTAMLFLDLIIITISGFVYTNLESPLYALISVFVSAKVLDLILNGASLQIGKFMFIISLKSGDIKEGILNNVSRGVTRIKSFGGYTNEESEILLCALKSHEVYKTYELIKNIDPKAFIIVGDAREIKGEGFGKLFKK